MKNILVINFGGIGDEILFLPTIATLKKEFKDCKITLCLEKRSRAIGDLTPLIDNMIFADIKAAGVKKYFEILKMLFSVWGKKFDMVVSSGKSPAIAIILFLTGIKRRLGYKTKTSFLLTDATPLNENQYAANMYQDLIKPLTDIECEPPKIEVKDEHAADYLLGDKFLKEGFVALHPGVSKMSVEKNIIKCPAPDFWVNLINGMLKIGKNVVLLGGPDDKETIEKIAAHINKSGNFLNLFGKTKNMMDMVRIINKAQCMICVDSAPMHAAVGLNKKVLAIFGGTNEEKLLPKSPNFIPVFNPTPCRPCLWDIRQTSCAELKCLDIKTNDILKYL